MQRLFGYWLNPVSSSNSQTSAVFPQNDQIKQAYPHSRDHTDLSKISQHRNFKKTLNGKRSNINHQKSIAMQTKYLDHQFYSDRNHQSKQKQRLQKNQLNKSPLKIAFITSTESHSAKSYSEICFPNLRNLQVYNTKNGQTWTNPCCLKKPFQILINFQSPSYSIKQLNFLNLTATAENLLQKFYLKRYVSLQFINTQNQFNAEMTLYASKAANNTQKQLIITIQTSLTQEILCNLAKQCHHLKVHLTKQPQPFLSKKLTINSHLSRKDLNGELHTCFDQNYKRLRILRCFVGSFNYSHLDSLISICKDQSSSQYFLTIYQYKQFEQDYNFEHYMLYAQKLSNSCSLRHLQFDIENLCLNKKDSQITQTQKQTQEQSKNVLFTFASLHDLLALKQQQMNLDKYKKVQKNVALQHVQQTHMVMDQSTAAKQSMESFIDCHKDQQQNKQKQFVSKQIPSTQQQKVCNDPEILSMNNNSRNINVNLNDDGVDVNKQYENSSQQLLLKCNAFDTNNQISIKIVQQHQQHKQQQQNHVINSFNNFENNQTQHQHVNDINTLLENKNNQKNSLMISQQQDSKSFSSLKAVALDGQYSSSQCKQIDKNDIVQIMVALSKSQQKDENQNHEKEKENLQPQNQEQEIIEQENSVKPEVQNHQEKNRVIFKCKKVIQQTECLKFTISPVFEENPKQLASQQQNSQQQKQQELQQQSQNQHKIFSQQQSYVSLEQGNPKIQNKYPFYQMLDQNKQNQVVVVQDIKQWVQDQKLRINCFQNWKQEQEQESENKNYQQNNESEQYAKSCYEEQQEKPSSSFSSNKSEYGSPVAYSSKWKMRQAEDPATQTPDLTKAPFNSEMIQEKYQTTTQPKQNQYATASQKLSSSLLVINQTPTPTPKPQNEIELQPIKLIFTTTNQKKQSIYDYDYCNDTHQLSQYQQHPDKRSTYYIQQQNNNSDDEISQEQDICMQIKKIKKNSQNFSNQISQFPQQKSLKNLLISTHFFLVDAHTFKKFTLFRQQSLPFSTRLKLKVTLYQTLEQLSIYNFGFDDNTQLFSQNISKIIDTNNFNIIDQIYYDIYSTSKTQQSTTKTTNHLSQEMKMIYQNHEDLICLQANSSFDKVLLYSKSTQTNYYSRNNIVFEYDLVKKCIVSKHVIPSILKQSLQFPIKQVKYQHQHQHHLNRLNQQNQFNQQQQQPQCQGFYILNQKQLCFMQPHFQRATIYAYSSLIDCSSHKSTDYEFDCFEVHKDGQSVVIAMNKGKQIKVFDLKRQKSVKGQTQRSNVSVNTKTKSIKKSNLKHRKSTQKQINYQQSLSLTVNVRRLRALNRYSITGQEDNIIKKKMTSKKVQPSQQQQRCSIECIKIIYNQNEAVRILCKYNSQSRSRSQFPLSSEVISIDCVEQNSSCEKINSFSSSHRKQNRSLLKKGKLKWLLNSS